MSMIKVLVIDDSALVRNLLRRILETDAAIEVVGTATDPYDAREKIKRLNPDVLTLDVEMPRMDGITFLKNLMRLRPLPVVMVSSLTEKGAETTLQALELGAVDFVCKPQGEPATAIKRLSAEIISKVKMAARTRLKRAGRAPLKEAGGEDPAGLDVEERYGVDVIIGKTNRGRGGGGPIIAVGASTGGTEAIKELLAPLPPGLPPIVITQHIPAGFSAAFANRMNRLLALEVCEAEDGQPLLAGHVYIAPGHSHLLVARERGGYCCRLNDGPRVNRHKPSVDVLFRSVAQCAGGKAIGILLTGMGDDGARCLLEMREAGAFTLCQDEESSVVWGMPGSAVKLGAACQVAPLGKIPEALLDQFSKMNHRGAAGTPRRAHSHTLTT